MGSASSKAASAAPKVAAGAAGAAKRQYPSSPSILNSASSTSNAPSYQNSPSTQTSTSTSTPPSPQPSSQVHPDPRAAPPSETKTSHIELDGRDPQFASSLRKLGSAVPVEKVNSNTQAFPTSTQPPIGQHGQNIFPPSPSSPSTTSSSNPSLKIVQARERIAQRFTEESENMGRASFGGRSLISAKEISDVIRFRMQGKSEGEIEKQLRLKPGVVRELMSTRGMVDNI